MLFEREELVEAIDELVDRLVAARAEVQVRVVGGAAIAVGNRRETLTGDIDALYGKNPIVDEVVAAMAADRNWPPKWLNDAVGMYASHFDDRAEWVTHRQRDGVTVLIAPTDLLLAMKLLAGRGRRDSVDVDALLDACQVTSTAEAEAIFERYYPREQIAAGAARQLAARFPSSPPPDADR